MSELMAQFEQLSRLEAEAAVQGKLLEDLVNRVACLEECMLASKLVRLDDQGHLVANTIRRVHTTRRGIAI